MIIEVLLDGEEEPRRYRVHRDDGDLCLRRLEPEGHGEIDEASAGEDCGDGAVRIDWKMPEPHVYSLLIEDRSYDVHIDEEDGDEERLTLHLLSRILQGRASDARKRRVGKAAAGPEGAVRLTAPMPGRVVKVLAPEGTVVSRGEGILVLEAMKMENELKAPRDGTVTRVTVSEGEGVEGGAHLATIE